MLVFLSMPLFVGAILVWCKVVFNRMSGGSMPFTNVADVVYALGVDVSLPWGWAAALSREIGGLDAGMVALAAAVGCLLVDLAISRRSY